MVLWIVKYFVDKDKLAEFRKYALEECLPHFLSISGLKWLRDLHNEHSRQLLWMAEIESYEAWGKTMDDPKTKKVMEKFRSFTHDVTWELWTPSEKYPEGFKQKARAH